MKKIIFITGVSGVGKTSIYESIMKSDLSETYNIFDTDMLEKVNINDKDSIVFTCINHNDVENLKLEDCVTRIVLITCNEEELKKRLSDKNDSFINEQIKYQEWFISNLDSYDANYDNTDNIDNTVDKIIDFIEIFE